MHAANRPKTLADRLGSGGLHLDRNLNWVGQILAGNASYLGGHRCREEGDLSLLGYLFENPFDIVDETHAQHLIGFVQDKGG